MKRTKGISRLFSALLLITIIGCSAEDGDIGPPGPRGEPGIQGERGERGEQGEEGTAGADGQDGEDGRDGEDGNANVIFSDWISADWNIRNDARIKEMRIPISEITNTELRNKTLVYMYLSQWGTPAIYTMPSSGRWSNVLYSFTFGITTPSFDGILVKLNTTDNTDLTEIQYAGFRGNQFRYVLVPESNQSGKLNYTNYEAVKAFYNLPN